MTGANEYNLYCRGMIEAETYKCTFSKALDPSRKVPSGKSIMNCGNNHYTLYNYSEVDIVINDINNFIREVTQLFNKFEDEASIDLKNLVNFREKYSKLFVDVTLQDPKGELEKIYSLEKIISDNFFELAGIAHTTEGSVFDDFPSELLEQIISYVLIGSMQDEVANIL